MKRPSSRWLSERLILVEVTAVLGWFSLRGIGRRSFWSDEGVTATVVSGSWADFTHGLRTEPNFALYYSILRGWARVSDTELWIRLPSALLAIATVPVLYSVSRRLFGTRAASIAIALFAFNGVVVAYAREARPYALVLFTSTLATLLFLRAIDRPSGGRWAAWATAALGVMLSHPVAVTVVVAHVVVLVVSRRAVPWRVVLRSTLVSLVVVVIIGQRFLQVGRTQLSWIPRTDADLILSVASFLAGGSWVWPLACTGIAALILIVAAVRGGGDGRPPWHCEPFAPRWSTMVVACWAVIPFALTVLVSLRQPLLVPRYLIFAVPAFAVVAGAGIARLPLPAAIVAAGVVITLMIPMTTDFLGGPRQDWREAAAALVSQGHPDDTFVVGPIGAETLRYYLGRALRARAPAVSNDQDFRAVHGGRPACLDRVWLLLSVNGSAGPVTAILGDTHSVAATQAFRGIRIQLYQRDAGAARPSTCPAAAGVG